MGLTIDYGPYGFMEYFDPDYVPNGSDGSARYSYEKQPEICKWNLKIFSQMLSPLLPLDISNEVFKEFDIVYDNEYMKNMRDKLGFLSSNDEIDRHLISELFSTMHGSSTDFTDTFQALISFVNTDKLPDDVDALVEKLLSRSATPAQLISINKRKMKIHQLGKILYRSTILVLIIFKIIIYINNLIIYILLINVTRYASRTNYANMEFT
jgi:uncharacterized protein YdiU (UPF0061 family)